LDLSHLNPSQRRAVLTTEGPLLVLAGAGSGKTRVITHRVAHLLEQGVDASHIVALSFTNKAAGEMRDRLAKMVGSKTASALHLATFHSLGAQMLRETPQGFGLPSSRFSILDQGDIFGMIRGLLREHGHHGANDRRYDIPGIVQRLSLWKNAFIETDAIERHIVDEYDVVAASIYGAFEDRLRTLGAVDFDDLVCLVARRLREQDDLRAQWRARFRYVMVDEYQDTNDAQFEFLRQLVSPPFNLCVVGDDDQAIYGWRGAKVENILGFDKVFPGTVTIKLQENYRCREPILACANAVVRNNRTRHEKTLIPTRGTGHQVDVVLAADGADEAAWIGKQIWNLNQREGVALEDIAVLYRSAQQVKPIEAELQQHGLAYRVLGGQSMFDKKEVKDAIAYLKTIVGPRDDLAVRRALETPSRGIGRKTMERLSSYAELNRISLLEAVFRHDKILDIPGRAVEALGRFSGMIRAAQARARERNDAASALQEVLEQVNLRDHVRHDTGSEQATEHRMAAVQSFVESVGRFERRCRDRGKAPKWSEYFGSMNLDNSKNDDDPEKQRGKVTLATMHSAKGLEWGYVFIIGVEEGTMPHRRVSSPRVSDAISGDIEEERRLFYVGITRARERLWITRAAARTDRGRSLPRPPSRFIEELPESQIRLYDIRAEEELSSEAIGDMAADFLSRIRPSEPEEAATARRP